jgi:hypothetical protein
MNDERKISHPAPGEEDRSVRKLVWMGVAFIPSLFGMACLQYNSHGNWGDWLMLINLIASVAGSVGIVRGMKTVESRVVWGLFLSLFFFGLNEIIVLFVGCTTGFGH